MDVVESVRLMEQDEDDFVQRWQRLVQQSKPQLLPSMAAGSSRAWEMA